jgi:hypothetical protein
MKTATYLFLSIILITISCKSEKTEIPESDYGKTATLNNELITPNNSATVIADSIMYITNVINPDPNEDYYMKQWLAGAKIEVLANFIFKVVYEGRLKAYNYTTGEEMTVDEVKLLDTENQRANIGQILFTENWYFDEKNLRFYKQVNSIMLAYFRYDEAGNLIGNKAGIRIYLNGTKPMRGALEY